MEMENTVVATSFSDTPTVKLFSGFVFLNFLLKYSWFTMLC